MDPLSISVAALAIAETIAKTTSTVAGFVRTARGARQDLVVTSRQLGELSFTLVLLGENNKNTDTLPDSLRSQIQSILENCDALLVELGTVLDSY